MSAHANFLQRRPLAQARTLLLAGVVPVGDEEVAVDDAAGRIASETVSAAHPAPHYRAAAMDGIALRAADTRAAADGAVTLRVLEAGAPEPAAGDACCVAIDTGSLLPDWADAMVRIEDTTTEIGAFRIKAVVPPGADVRRAGEDIGVSTVLVPCGARIRAWDIGAMLATGVARVRVRRRPRVAILATGGEVIEPTQAALPGQVIEYNSRMIAALVEDWGGSAHRLGIVADDPASLERAVADAAARFDVVGVIAGSSAGRKDFTIATLAALGDVFVHGVDISPGRPVALARIARADRRNDAQTATAVSDDGTPGRREGSPAAECATPVIAIPGYPVSAIVVCEQLLRPLVAALLGAAEPCPPRLRARLVRKIASRVGMEEFRRVCLVRQADSSYVVAPLASGAGSISTVSAAHAWLRIAAGAEGLDAGEQVDVELLVPVEDVDAAFVLAGEPCAASAAFEDELRRTNPRTRVAHLRRGSSDRLATVERGEAHGAIVGADEASTVQNALDLRELPGTAMLLAVRHADR